MIDSRAELVAGVCPLLYYPEEPHKVLITRELTAKKLTGKLAGMWELGYETVEQREDHRAAIYRFFQEEVRIVDGRVFIPKELEAVKLCVVRISPPEMAAWIHVYACPVSEDLILSAGNFRYEVENLLWVDSCKILEMENEAKRILFRAGTYEILKSHLARLSNPDNFKPLICENPINLPNWEVYRLMEEGLSQSEALCQLGIDPRPLEQSMALIHSL